MGVDMHDCEPELCGTCLAERRHASRADQKDGLVDSYAQEFIQRGWVREEDLNWLKLCLEETLVNAMVHGNEGDPALDVEVTLWEDGDDWMLVVSDQGDGFDLDEVPDPEDPDSLMFEHGRGILLMSDWLDSLVYFRHGATAVLRRRKAGVA